MREIDPFVRSYQIICTVSMHVCMYNVCAINFLCLSLVRYNNKTYRIDDIDWQSNPQGTFKLHSGEEITYMDYYKKVSLQVQFAKLASSCTLGIVGHFLWSLCQLLILIFLLLIMYGSFAQIVSHVTEFVEKGPTLHTMLNLALFELSPRKKYRSLWVLVYRSSTKTNPVLESSYIV